MHNLLAVLIFTLAAASFAAQGEQLEGRIVGVSDGDTLTLLDREHRQHRVRLAGIDAPEKQQDFGTRSKESLAALAFGKAVVAWGTKYDRYGRFVAKVIVDGSDINLRQLERGLAWHYKAYAGEQNAGDRVAYAQAEAEARNAGRGLWSLPDPLPPWEFRKHGRSLSEPR